MNQPHGLLAQLDGPEDLRKLPDFALPRLAAELRALIMEVVSKNGGHLASNLGVVELAIALHRVFRSPMDTVIWDVGHQCYAHKILTGRRDRFPTLRLRGGISGYPKRSESPHDPVETGHASTAISYGLGIVEARERLGVKGKVIAVVGDGALSGGLALAGLNNAGHARKNLIIILNDNEMSIGRNVGALSSHLGRLTTTRFYQIFRRGVETALSRVPFIGGGLLNGASRLKKGFKALLYRENLFADMGFEYVGPIDGHDIRALTRILRNLRNVDGPVVVHVTTRKGRGYAFAEDDPTRFHGVMPFSLLDGKFEESAKLTFSEAFSRIVTRLAEEDPRVVGVTAAMIDGTGLRSLKQRNPGRVFDVGIAEDHAVTFSAGLALAGLRPVVAVYSTFLQRAVDQVIHDVAIPRLPVIFAVDRAGLVPADGETHQGAFDISLFSPVPGLAIMAPANRGEMALCFRHALATDSPTIIRYPKAVCGPDLEELSAPLEPGRGVFVRFLRSEALLINVGGLLPEVLKAAHLLNMAGISMDIYNLRFVKPLDLEYLQTVLSMYGQAVLVEEGASRGGVGEHISRLLHESGSTVSFRSLGIPDQFLPQGNRDELLAAAGLDGEAIAKVVRELCEIDSRAREVPAFAFR